MYSITRIPVNQMLSDLHFQGRLAVNEHGSIVQDCTHSVGHHFGLNNMVGHAPDSGVGVR